MIFQVRNRFQKRFALILDRLCLWAARKLLGHVLERVLQPSADDLHQRLKGLYETNITTALQLARHMLERARQSPADRLKEQQRLCQTSLRITELMDQAVVLALGREILSTQLKPEDRFLIPRLEPRDKPVLNTWRYQNEVMQWDIKPNDLVLDIGSGGWPFGMATHLADMFLEKTTHRFEPLRRDERPLLVIDICHMPFGDNTWDFAFCSHVLEHLDRPGDAIRELNRVSRQGYIEVPTRLSDVMLNFTQIKNHHRWHGLVLGDTLVFIEWKNEERRDFGGSYFFNCLHSIYYNEFQELFEKNWDMFYAMLRWEEKTKFLIINNEGLVIDRSTNG